MRLLLVLSAAVLVVAACSTDTGETTSTTSAPAATAASTTSTTVAPATTTTATSLAPRQPLVPEQLEDLTLISISLDEVSLNVAVADTPELRRSGLMFVEDLEDLDGMLFVFDADTSGGFWMKNTLIPLDIAFFDVDGRFVDGFVMEPCTADPCLSYFPDGDYRFALEMAEGTMPENPAQLETG